MTAICPKCNDSVNDKFVAPIDHPYFASWCGDCLNQAAEQVCMAIMPVFLRIRDIVTALAVAFSQVSDRMVEQGLIDPNADTCQAMEKENARQEGE